MAQKTGDIIRKGLFDANSASAYILVMDRSAVIAKLRAHETELREFGLTGLSLFGSVARGDARPESDIDLFCDYNNPRFSLIDLIKAEHRISDLLGAPVDLGTRDSLRAEIRSKVEAAALKIF